MRKLLLALIAFALLVPAAAAGPPPKYPIDIDVAKQAGGPWIDNGFVRKNVDKKTESIFWRVRNREDHKLDLTLETLKSGSGAGDYRVRWFRGDKDITKEARDGEFAFGLRSGEKKTFEATLNPKVSNPGPVCIIPFFTVHNDVIGDYSYGVYVNDDGVCG